MHRTESGRCPGCGAASAACGHASDSVPVDERMMEVATVGGPLSKYRYRSPGGQATVLKLNSDDAARLGLTDADLVGASVEPETGLAPEADTASQAAAKGRATAANKARTATNKAAAPTGKSRGKTAPADSAEPVATAAGDGGQTSADSGDSGPAADAGNGGSGGGD